MEQFSIIETIGEGSFGVVFKAKYIITDEIVAIKRIKMRKTEMARKQLLEGDASESFPYPFVREMMALQQLQHPNIVQLKTTIPHGDSMIMVFEYMVTDLSAVLRSLKKPMPEAHIKSYMQMLLRGIAYCHDNGVMHRDLKPANLLISSDGELKLGDFGQARVFMKNDPDGRYTSQISTRWYRAPEVLYGAKKYDEGVDLWSVGCIFAELVNSNPLFAGESDIDQLYQVLHTLGTPTPEIWPQMMELPDYHKITFPPMHAVPFESLFVNASSQALRLLKQFLVYPSQMRLRSRDALQSTWFFNQPWPVKPPTPSSGHHHSQLFKHSSHHNHNGNSNALLDIEAPFKFPTRKDAL